MTKIYTKISQIPEVLKVWEWEFPNIPPREELSQIALKNEWILTESFERVRYIQKFLGMVDITDIRWMAVNHPISMSVNPITIKDFIEQNRAEGKSDEEIRNLIMNDFEKYFKA